MIGTDNKDNPVVKSILDSLSSAKEALEAEIAGIEEEYKKKLEEAKATLKAHLEEITKQYNYWAGTDIIVAAPKKRRTRKTADAPVADDGLKVVDKDVEETTETDDPNTALLFDNPEDTEKEQTEGFVGEPADEAPEFDGAGFTEEDNHAEDGGTQTEQSGEEVVEESVENLFGEETKNEESDAPKNDPWPEIPDEW